MLDPGRPSAPIRVFASGCPGQQTFVTILLQHLDPDLLEYLREPIALADLDLSVDLCAPPARPSRAAISGLWACWGAWLREMDAKTLNLRSDIVSAMGACEPTLIRVGFWHLPLLDRIDIDSVHNSDLPRLAAGRIANFLDGLNRQEISDCLRQFNQGLSRPRPACLHRHVVILSSDGWRAFGTPRALADQASRRGTDCIHSESAKAP